MNSHHIPVYSVLTIVSFWLNGWSPVDDFIHIMNFIGADVCVTIDHALFIQNRISKNLFRHKFCEEVSETDGSKQNVIMEGMQGKETENNEMKIYFGFSSLSKNRYFLYIGAPLL